MNFKQEKAKTKISFTINSDSLEYSMKDRKQDIYALIPLEDIENDKSIIEDESQATSTRMWQISSVMIGIGFFLYIRVEGTLPPLTPIVIPVLLLTFALLKYYAIKYTVLNSKKQKIYILHDNSHDMILENIFYQRNKYLRDNFTLIDEKKPISDELNKFLWLKRLGAISEKEYETYKSKLNQ